MQRAILPYLLLPILLAGGCMLLLAEIQASPTNESSPPTTASGEPASPDGKSTPANGIVYQASHYNSRTDSSKRTASWFGDLQALSVDASGNPRPLWSALQQLAAVGDVTVQRNYAAPADSGRHIFTYLDLDGDGKVGEAEVNDFLPSTFNENRYGILDVKDHASAEALVNYVRGDDSANSRGNLRNRTLDFLENGNPQVMRLGDIIHSTAVEVGAPSEAYDLLYGDLSYGTFRKQYSERRRVVYVGANDGMLHAFNAGFRDSSGRSRASDSAVQHPLGSELWAYVPYNLLPHLKQLMSPAYAHTWYVDGSPRVFDARIFQDDAAHPGGWGTIMVIGMRLGGSRIRLNDKTDARSMSEFSFNGLAATEAQWQSAYVLMDITDPEQKPTLLAEITDADDMGYTTSRPAIAAFARAGKAADASGSHWYLIFGSGPALVDAGQEIPATANDTAKLYVYDLGEKRFIQNKTRQYLYDLSGEPASFLGDPVAVDWNLDYRADALYFGTISGDAATPGGKLFKLDFKTSSTPSTPVDWAAPAVLVDMNNPLVAAPTVTRDEYNNHWIIAGTGRNYSAEDRVSTKKQSLLAVIDTLPTRTVDYGKLMQAGNENRVNTGVAGQNRHGTSSSATAQLAREKKGWKRTLNAGIGSSAERSINRIALLGNTLFATTIVPDSSGNEDQNRKRLYCLNYKTGAADEDSASCGHSSAELTAHGAPPGLVDLGHGPSTSVVLQASATGSADLFAYTQTSSGVITSIGLEGLQNFRSGEIDWRELRQ